MAAAVYSIVHVLFDTNELFGDKARFPEVVDSRARKLVATHFEGITVHWWVPNVVRGEREYQMFSEAKKRRTASGELTRFMDAPIVDLSDERLLRVAKRTVGKQLRELGFTEWRLRLGNMSWRDITNRAIYREKPFTPDDSSDGAEKGFRDALIWQSFNQIIENRTSPGSSFVIVSNDAAFHGFLEEVFRSRSDIRVVRTCTDASTFLVGLVGERVGRPPEELERLRIEAQLLIDPVDQESWFNKSTIADVIRERFKSALDSVPSWQGYVDLQRSNDDWVHFSTVPLDQQQSLVSWQTLIGVRATLTGKLHPMRWGDTSWVVRSASGLLVMPHQTGRMEYSDPPMALIASSPELSRDFQEQLELRRRLRQGEQALIASGITYFEIDWTTQVTPEGKLKDPKVQRIELARLDLPFSTEWGFPAE